jgi:hypothetical protein
VTRKNLCPNPSVGANVTGWAGTAGPPTRVTGVAGMPVTTAARYTGTGYIQTPTGAASPGLAYTMSLYFTNNTGFSISGKTIYFTFTRSAGGDDFSQTFTIPTIASGATGRVSQTFTAPALATGMYWIIDTLNGSTGTGIDVSAALYEQAASLASYADGDTSGWSWDGTAENSTSSESGTSTVTSDLAVTYRVANSVTSDLAVTYRVSNTITSDLSVRYRVGADIAPDTGATYELEEIMDALAATFDGVQTGDTFRGQTSTISCSPEVPGQITVPAIVLELDDLEWDLQMGGGADAFTILGTVLVQFQDSDTAQRELWRVLSRRVTSGVGRIKAVLEANRDLGGLVSYVHLARVRNIGTIEYNGVPYLGAELIFEVMS